MLVVGIPPRIFPNIYYLFHLNFFNIKFFAVMYEISELMKLKVFYFNPFNKNPFNLI